MKRAFYILFSIYFLSLVFIPCGDKEDCNEIKHSQTAQAEDHDHQDETCTPFCVCSCCAAHFLIKDFQASISQIGVVNTIYTQHSISELPEICLPIWQPPKVA